MKRVSVIIPFLNEQESIPVLVSALNQFFSAKSLYKAEVIFVNDGSNDNSSLILKQQNFKGYTAKIIGLSRNFGAHAALRAGIANSTGNYITFMYADLQDPLTLVDQLLAECEKGHDICWASRNNSAAGFFSKMYARLIKRYVSKDFPDNGFDIVMFNQKVRTVLNANIENNSSIFLQILTLGFKSTAFTYTKTERTAGKSKWTFSKRIKLMIDSFVSFSYAPIRFVTVTGILLFIIGVLFSIYLVVRKFMYNDLVSGWPMLISILMMGFGVTNISLGIIAEYLWRTLDVARKRPVFIIDEIADLHHE